eukprot:SM000255S08768  [mRNA]  locus=s255:170703:174046:+ [translate_table: standard]
MRAAARQVARGSVAGGGAEEWPRGGSSWRRGALRGAGAVLLAASCAQLSLCEEAQLEREKEKTALDPKDFVRFKLKEVENVNHNTKKFRFEFDPDTKLGLNVASCLITRAPVGKEGEEGKPKFVIRPYTPISDPDSQGYFDLLIKVYPQGVMSKHIHSLTPGDELEVKGPIPKVAGGTGITPMLQIIDAILKNPDDHTQVSLVFANVTSEDILLKGQLDARAFKYPNLKVFYVVDHPDKDWHGGVGRTNADILKKALPAPSDDTLILVCGPPGMMNNISGDKNPDRSQGEVQGLLKDLGYTKDQVYKF